MPNSTATKNRVAALTALKEFQSGAMRGTWDGEIYRVNSYAVTIAECDRGGAIRYYDPAKYSATTSSHQSAVKAAWGLSGAAIDRRGDN